MLPLGNHAGHVLSRLRRSLDHELSDVRHGPLQVRLHAHQLLVHVIDRLLDVPDALCVLCDGPAGGIGALLELSELQKGSCRHWSRARLGLGLALLEGEHESLDLDEGGLDPGHLLLDLCGEGVHVDVALLNEA